MRIKNPTERLRKKCVERAKKIVKKKAGYKCAYCGQYKEGAGLHGSHVLSEGIYKSMSADLDNIIALCAIHHMSGYWNLSNKWSWHGTPLEAVKWFQEKYPDQYKELIRRSQKSVQADEYYWKQKWEYLKGIDF